MVGDVHYKGLGWIGLISFLLLGCYERQEGCLDALANNFDLDADRNCCCTYPNLIFDVKHLMDTVNLNPNTMYTNDLGQSFEIRKLDFFISGARLTKDGVDFMAGDSLLIELTVGSVEIVIMDIIRLNKNQFQYTLGVFKEPGNFDRLKFFTGLKEPLSGAVPGQFETGSPLFEPGNPLLDDQLGYLNFSIELARDTTDEHVFQLKSHTPLELVEIDLELQVEKNKGRNLVILLDIDYYQWFRDLDLEGDPVEVMREKIREGISHSFSVSN